MMPEGDAEYHCEMAEACRRVGQLADAITHARRAIALKPNFGAAYNRLGAALRDGGKLDEAIESFRRAVQIQPESVQAWNDLGNALCEKGEFDPAIAAYRKVIELDPKFFQAHSNLGVALVQKGDLNGAIVSQRKAIEIKTDFAPAYNNLGSALLIAGRLDEAEKALDRVIQLQGDMAEAHFSRSLIWLVRGDFKRGWPEYEWRLRGRSVFMYQSPRFAQPRWDGGELHGKTIFLYSEAGFGDTLQFVRYVPMVAERGGCVILGCQAQLAGLLRGLPGVQRIVTPGMPLPGFDVHCPLLSLPLAFSTNLETIPAREAYLRADVDLAARWKSRVDSLDSGLKIGVAWAGDSRHRLDRWRSMSFEMFSKLMSADGAKFLSLQKDRREQTQVRAGISFADWTHELQDFSATAALIANLDLVIAVDTAVAHLAAAMGKRVWLLLSASPDFRWMLDREDSSWYPTMRLFRQKSLGDWSGVIQNVTDALHAEAVI